MNNIVIIMKNF